MYEIKISKENNKKILKDFLLEYFDNLSSSKINKEIRNGNIKINNKKTTWNYLLITDDVIKIYLNNLFKKSNYQFLKADILKSIIYEDQNIIIVNKPLGIICQPDQNEKINTLNNQIKNYLYQKNDLSYKQSNLVHRIDKYTFGLCLAAKNNKTLKEINKLWNTECINKFYLCLCYGNFKEKNKTLINYVYYDEWRGKMVIDVEKKFNQQIKTKYWVIKQYEDYALVKAQILTGKKHQLRLHFSIINHPILGDTKYNKINVLNYKFPTLCSYQIIFNFPKSHYLSYLNKKSFKLNKWDFK